jgi:hypothetical protein
MNWTATVGKSFNVTVDRVLNPNASPSITSEFEGFIKCGFHVQDYTKISSSYTFSQYANKMSIDLLESSTLFYREIANIHIRANATAGIAGTDYDKILVDFPVEYEQKYV